MGKRWIVFVMPILLLATLGADDPNFVMRKKFTAAATKASDDYWTAIIRADKSLVDDLGAASNDSKADAAAAKSLLDAAKEKLDSDIQSRNAHIALPGSHAPDPASPEGKRLKSIDEAIKAIPPAPDATNPFAIDKFNDQLHDTFVNHEISVTAIIQDMVYEGPNRSACFSIRKSFGDRGNATFDIYIEQPTQDDISLFEKIGDKYHPSVKLKGRIMGASYSNGYGGYSITFNVRCTIEKQ